MRRSAMVFISPLSSRPPRIRHPVEKRGPIFRVKTFSVFGRTRGQLGTGLRRCDGVGGVRMVYGKGLQELFFISPLSSRPPSIRHPVEKRGPIFRVKTLTIFGRTRGQLRAVCRDRTLAQHFITIGQVVQALDPAGKFNACIFEPGLRSFRIGLILTFCGVARLG